MVFIISFILPFTASAGLVSYVSGLFGGTKDKETEITENSQNIQLLQGTLNPKMQNSNGGPETTIVGGTALLAETGPVGSGDFVYENNGSGQVSVYVVREGDTLSTISEMFGVSVNTIMWGNDLTSKSIKPGQTLAILPVNGVKHKVAKGDTIQSITKKYSGDLDEVLEYNNLSVGSKLVLGDEIIVPHGQIITESKPKTIASKPKTTITTGVKSYVGYFLRPLQGGIKTQGIHGYNGIDIGASIGTPILASADGQVVIARNSGWNGGYGKYIVIEHPNGIQTLYGHANQVIVSIGQQVNQGDVIGYVGNTGRSTGPHLHFEIRGAANPF